MENFVDVFSKKSKNWVYGALIAIVLLLALNFIFDFAYMIKDGTASFWGVTNLILSAAVHIGVWLFGLFMYKNKNERAFRAFFVLYFGFVFVSKLLYVFENLGYFGYNSVFFIFVGIFAILASLLVSLIGILTTIDYVKGTNNYVKLVQNLLIVYLAVIVGTFVLYFVGTCTRHILWTHIVAPFVDLAVALVFVGCYNTKYEADEPSPKNELKFNDEPESDSNQEG